MPDSTTTRPIAIATPAAPTPTGAYSQAIVAGDQIVLSGQAPFDADGRLAATHIEGQVRQCFANLAAVAEAAGASLEQAIRIGAYVSPRADLAAYNSAYREIVTWEPAPARTTIISDLPGFLVEIDAILWRG